MKSRSLFLHSFVLLTILLIACGVKAPAETATPTPVPTTATMTPITQPMLTPKAQPTEPTLLIVPTNSPEPGPAAPEWNLEGLGQILFIRDTELYVMRLEDASTHWLASQDMLGEGRNASWSPNGRQIVLVCEGWDICVINADGSELRNLTNSPKITDYSPAWSPTGSQIAFSTKLAQVWAGQDYYADIYIMDVDGSNLEKLTESNMWASAVTWSPAGGQILFLAAGERDGMYVVDIESKELTFLYPYRLATPVWSPDGQTIAFSASGGDRDTTDIFTIKPDGSNLHRLTDNAFFDSNPVWSPDGRYLAFERSQGGGRVVYIIDREGTHETQLTFDTEIEKHPTWSPDGKYIVYYSSVDGPGIYVVDVQSGQSKKILEIGKYPFWAPMFVSKFDSSPMLPDCTSGWTRLTTNSFARISSASSLPNRVRSEPKKSDNVIAQIFPGMIVKVLEGPICTDGYVFWKVENPTIPGGSGWTAEGESKEYWLEPYKP